MEDAIKDFYAATKLLSLEETAEEPSPITHVRVFHKSYPRFPRTALIKRDRRRPLDLVLSSRKSNRDFRGRLTLAQLSRLLLSCRIVDRQVEPERRTYPSAGARFPIELYVIVFDVKGLPNGFYHYNIVDESLELLLPGDPGPIHNEIVSPFVHNAAAALVMTSVLSRSAVKYGVKAYPYSLLEAGHMGQNLILTCAGLGLGCCPVGGFVNRTITAALDLVEDEIPLYVIAVGKPRTRRQAAGRLGRGQAQIHHTRGGG